MYNILFSPERMHSLHPSQGQQQKPPDCLKTTSCPRSYLEDIRLVAEVQRYLDGLVEAALAAALTAQRHAGRDTTRHDTYARHTTSISRLTERYFGHELSSTTSTTSTSILFFYSTLLYLVISALRSSMVAEGDITVFWSNANQNYLSVVWSLSSKWPGVIGGCLLPRFDIDNQI